MAAIAGLSGVLIVACSALVAIATIFGNVAIALLALAIAVLFSLMGFGILSGLVESRAGAIAAQLRFENETERIRANPGQAELDIRAAEALQGDLAVAREKARLAGQQVTQTLSVHYGVEADNARRSARIVLILGALAVCALFALVADVIVFPPAIDSSSPTAVLDLVRFSLPRALLVTLIAYLVRFAVRAYNINRNAEAASTQKRVALDTFGFLASTIGRDDAATLRELTVSIARIVLAPYETGYLGDRDSPAADAVSLLKAMRE